MSYDSASLTTPDIHWLGLRPSDLNKYDLPDQCRLDMTENDIKTGKELLNEDFIQKNPKWMKVRPLSSGCRRVCCCYQRIKVLGGCAKGENHFSNFLPIRAPFLLCRVLISFL